MRSIVAIGQVDLLRRWIEVFLGEEMGDGRYMRYDAQGKQEIIPEGEIAKSTLRLTDEQAKALLQELIRYYDGGEDTRTLRKDYDAERSRVDKLTDAVIDLAKRGSVFVDERR